MLLDSPEALLRTLVVGVLAYVILVLLLRVSGKRTLSKWNAFDFVVTVAFGSILSTALLSPDTTVAQGALAITILVVLQFAITWLSVRFGLVQRWIKSQPALLLLRGELQQDTLKRERVTEGEVRAALRARGVGALEEVEAVVLETDGSFSVIQTLKSSSASALLDVEDYPAG
ncbi:DUF421 domain-containing protein [soil metagenome]|nr:DUF421 domain-containing protein [Gemmatimonadota bacterium]